MIIILSHNKRKVKQYNVRLFDDKMINYNGWWFVDGDWIWFDNDKMRNVND